MLSTMPLPAKKKPSRSTQESGPQPNLLVHQGPPPHRQDRPILPAAPAPLGGAAKLMDGKPLDVNHRLETGQFKSPLRMEGTGIAKGRCLNQIIAEMVDGLKTPL